MASQFVAEREAAGQDDREPRIGQAANGFENCGVELFGVVGNQHATSSGRM